MRELFAYDVLVHPGKMDQIYIVDRIAFDYYNLRKIWRIGDTFGQNISLFLNENQVLPENEIFVNRDDLELSTYRDIDEYPAYKKRIKFSLIRYVVREVNKFRENLKSPNAVIPQKVFFTRIRECLEGIIWLS